MAHTKARYEEITSFLQAGFCFLHGHVKDGVLQRGWMVETAKMFSVDGSTMGKFWSKMSKNCFAAKLLLLLMFSLTLHFSL